MTGESVRRAGKALFGPSWRYPFEMAFSISGRKLQRVLAGDEDIGTEMTARIAAALVARRQEIHAILEGQPSCQSRSP